MYEGESEYLGRIGTIRKYIRTYLLFLIMLREMRIQLTIFI